MTVYTVNSLDKLLLHINENYIELKALLMLNVFKPTKANKMPKDRLLYMLSMWDKNYRVRPKVTLKETQNIERPNLQGKEKEWVGKLKVKSPQKRLRQGIDI